MCNKIITILWAVIVCSGALFIVHEREWTVVWWTEHNHQIIGNVRNIPLSNIDSASDPVSSAKEYLKNFQKEAYCKISVSVQTLLITMDSLPNFSCQWEHNIWISSILIDENKNIFRIFGIIPRDIPADCPQDWEKIWIPAVWTMPPNLLSVWSLHNTTIVVNNQYFILRTLQDGEENITQNLPDCQPNIRLKK